MRNSKVLCCMLIAAVVSLSAQEKQGEGKKGQENEAAKPSTAIVPTFGATIFAHYAYVTNGTDGRDFSKFDMERAYVTMKAPIAEDWKFQITTDIYRNAAAGSYYAGLSVRLKFGYLDYSPFQGLSVKFGLIPGSWNATEETQWKYRGVDKTISDKYGYYSTADLGISATYALPGKLGEVAGYMTNGDGYSAPEANRYKDYIVRATITPFVSAGVLKTLALSGIASIGSAGTRTSLERNRYGAQVGYSHSFASVGLEYMVRKDAPSNPDTVKTGKIWSLAAEIRAPFADLQSKLSLLVRFDGVESNVDTGGDMTHFLIVGLAWKAADKLTIALDHQLTVAETNTLKRATDGVNLDTDRRWFVHTIFAF